MAAPGGYRRNPNDSLAALTALFQPVSLVDKIFTSVTVFPEGCNRIQATWIIAREDALRRREESPSDTAVALAIANAIAPSICQLLENEANAHVNTYLGIFLAREVNRREYVILDQLWAPAAGQVAVGAWQGRTSQRTLGTSGTKSPSLPLQTVGRSWREF